MSLYTIAYRHREVKPRNGWNKLSYKRKFFLLDAFIVPASPLMRESFSLPQRKVALFGEVKSPDH